jgi:branched-chain amino acid transport system substrate-binding protein
MHGFELSTIAVDHPGQEQGNQWLQIRRERPDYVVMWGWGVMNQVAVQEAINTRFPMENFIGNWWAGADHDVEQAGADAAGYRALNMNRLGDMPIFAEIQEHVIDAGLAAGDGTNLGNVLYTRGMYAAMLAAEAARTAQEIHGRRYRRIHDARRHGGAGDDQRAHGRAGHARYRPGIRGVLRGPWRHRHGDHAAVGRQQWVTLTDFIAPDDSVTQPLVMEDSAQYAAENNISSQCTSG